MKIREKNKNNKPNANQTITVRLGGPYLMQRYEELNEKDLLSGRSYWPMKRLMDVLICILALPFFLLIILVTCIVIKIDTPGPAILYEMRTGKGGQRFKMYRLRTWALQVVEMKKQFMQFKGLKYSDFNINDNPRSTRIGNFLQKHSIDHLPQIFNVLRGDMSLVGPRPTAISSNTYELWQTERLEVTPGITGLWQISGRDKFDFNERLRLDIAYIRNQSLLVDIQILLRTIGYVIARDDAQENL